MLFYTLQKMKPLFRISSLNMTKSTEKWSFTCSKLEMGALEQGVEYVNNKDTRATRSTSL